MKPKVGLILIVSLLAGCAVGPRYHEPAENLPEKFVAAGNQAATAAAEPATNDSWWRAFNDERLDDLVIRAAAANPDVRIALAHLQAAQSYEAVVLGHALPELDASAAAGRGTGTDLARSRAQQPLVSADSTTGLKHISTLAGFDTVWELDLFGKFRREFEAAQASEQAAAAARESVLTTVIADLTRAYVDLRGFQVQLAVLGKARDALTESLRIVNIRYQRGITNELDVALAQRELSTLSAQIEPLQAKLHAAEYTIATLVGDYPENVVQALDAPELIPSSPAAVLAGAPVELLRRRPDVIQAERELAAANARIGVATANLFPHISLVAAIGSQSQGWGTLPSVAQHIWSFGPAAAWPLLDFGALDAQVEIARQDARARLEFYRKTVLTAVGEVDTALDAYRGEEQSLTQLSTALMAAQRAVELATQRYDRGLTDFLNVVDAERQLYDLELSYAAVQVQQDREYVNLSKSLGGGWQEFKGVPSPRTPMPAIVALFERTLKPARP